MARGHWVRIYEGVKEDEARILLIKERDLGRKAKITRKRLGIGWWRTVWRWVK